MALRTPEARAALLAATKPQRRRDNPEEREQIAVVAFCRAFEKQYPALRWVHASLNGIATTPGQKARAMRAGGVRGIWDLFVPIRGGHIHPWGDRAGLYIEMKSATGQLTREQKDFQALVESQNYRCIVCRDWLHAARAIVDYLGIHDPAIEQVLRANVKGEL